MPRFQWLAAPCLGLILCLSAPLAAAPPAASLTGPQVLDRCRQAYDSLTSYAGTTHSTTGKTPPTSAHVTFLRPNKVKVDGTTMFGSKFAFLSDGHTTWILQYGRWERIKSTEMAIATCTGISGQAATTIPALLLHTKWGYPLSKSATAAPKVIQEKVSGHATYRVQSSLPFSRTFWIDQKTFRLVKMSTKIATFSNVQTFTDSQINPKIAPAAFARPPGVR